MSDLIEESSDEVLIVECSVDGKDYSPEPDMVFENEDIKAAIDARDALEGSGNGLFARIAVYKRTSVYSNEKIPRDL